MIDLDQIKNIHFIGIGGAGMSALANVLIKRGFHVSGSDAKPGDMATKLAKEGALVFIGHAACQIERAEVIVVSTSRQSRAGGSSQARCSCHSSQ